MAEGYGNAEPVSLNFLRDKVYDQAGQESLKKTLYETFDQQFRERKIPKNIYWRFRETEKGMEAVPVGRRGYEAPERQRKSKLSDALRKQFVKKEKAIL